MPGNRRNKSVWFMAGLGLGALAGILYAPRSGRETRKAIATGVDDGLEHIKALRSRTRERMGAMMDFAKKSFARKKQQAAAAVHGAKVLLKRPA